MPLRSGSRAPRRVGAAGATGVVAGAGARAALVGAAVAVDAMQARASSATARERVTGKVGAVRSMAVRAANIATPRTSADGGPHATRMDAHRKKWGPKPHQPC